MIRDYLPYPIYRHLFGDRKLYGNCIDEKDPDWLKFNDYSEEWHNQYKESKINRYIDQLGYKILENIDLTGKTVLEIGAGTIPHLSFIKGKPSRYIIVDVREHFLELAREKLKHQCETLLLKNRMAFPEIESNSIDVVITFYSLEHIPNLDDTLAFYHKVLKPGGFLVGAIPNEGGIAWGVGRSLTTQRTMKKKGFNYNKIICWEHVNFCDKIINNIEKAQFKKKIFKSLPFSKIKSFDFNLISAFVYTK